MTAKLLSRRDLEFLLYEWLDVVDLCARPRFADHTRETFDAVLASAERIAVERFLPHRRKADLEEPVMDGESVRLLPEIQAALAAFADAGLTAATCDYGLGGMQLPRVVHKAAFAWFGAANVATTGYALLTIGNANLLLAHGTAAQIDAFVRPMLAGRATGTMCLSEPQAGSSLADIATRAEPDGTSPLGARYRLFGSKMWISGGEHELTPNIVHLVLAKIPGGPPGVKGLSLFAVPRRVVAADGTPGERNDIALAGVNHKMGYRGTVNTLLSLGEGRFRPEDRPGAVGYLVGEANQGLACMFHMMNEARIGIGLGAVALGYAGYLESLDYARHRPQGRPIEARDPQSAPVAIVEHADVRRMLLAQKAYVEAGLALSLYCARLVDERDTAPDEAARRRAGLLLDLLTPVAKSWPAQWCLAANDLAIQVHGGYGYTRDFPVEQLYRDNRLNAIHEGTHGIQAIDLLDRRVALAGGAAFELLCAAMVATGARARAAPAGRPGSSATCDLAVHADALDAAVGRLSAVTRTLQTVAAPALRLANATTYLEAFGHVVAAWIWLEQALAADGRAGPFYEGKRQACRWFFRCELPRTTPQFELLERVDDTSLAMRDEWY